MKGKYFKARFPGQFHSLGYSWREFCKKSHWRTVFFNARTSPIHREWWKRPENKPDSDYYKPFEYGFLRYKRPMVYSNKEQRMSEFPFCQVCHHEVPQVWERLVVYSGQRRATCLCYSCLEYMEKQGRVVPVVEQPKRHKRHENQLGLDL